MSMWKWAQHHQLLQWCESKPKEKRKLQSTEELLGRSLPGHKCVLGAFILRTAVSFWLEVCAKGFPLHPHQNETTNNQLLAGVESKDSRRLGTQSEVREMPVHPAPSDLAFGFPLLKDLLLNKLLTQPGSRHRDCSWSQCVQRVLACKQHRTGFSRG